MQRWIQVELGRVRLEGPLAAVRVRAGPSWSASVAGELARGEERTVAVPIPDRGDLGHEVSIEHGGTGAATFLGAVERDPAPDLAAALGERPPPPIGAPDVRAGAPALLVLVAALLLVLGLRRRPALALGAGLALALALAWLGGRAGDEAHVRVLEGDGSHWVQVDAASEDVALLPSERLEVRCVPPSAGIAWTVSLAPEAWRVGPDPDAAAAAVLVRRALAPGDHGFGGAVNAWGRLEATWVRSADGSWAAHGAWRVGEPLPEPLAGGSDDPPGWLAAGLPPGTGVLLARLAPGSFGSAGAAGSVFLRLSGFRESH